MRAFVASLLVCLSSGLSLAGELPRAIIPDDFPVPGATSVLLGRDLFFDLILSGNQNTACASCHSPATASADALPLALGEGATGTGTARRANGTARRIARHTPHLFNLGAAEFKTLMHDGRVETDPSSRFGIRLPKGQFLERPVTSSLAAQALLPMVSADEMAGLPGSNPIADAVAQGRITGMNGAWQMIAQRVSDTPQYRQRFDWLIGPSEPLHITHITQALADFITYEYRATDSPFDAFLRGDDTALSNDALRGMALFYGKASCASCHAGPFQTDHSFHAIGLPQIGPGKAHEPATSDHGRGAITGQSHDNYRFRTPSLRNVALTAPYGHSGAFSNLRSMIRHHLDPLTSLAEYMIETSDIDQGAMADFDEILAITAAIEIPAVTLSDRDVTALISFLNALTDTSFSSRRLGPPLTVPSGLPMQGIETPPS